jgi:hypothetical protein
LLNILVISFLLEVLEFSTKKIIATNWGEFYFSDFHVFYVFFLPNFSH